MYYSIKVILDTYKSVSKQRKITRMRFSPYSANEFLGCIKVGCFQMDYNLH